MDVLQVLVEIISSWILTHYCTALTYHYAWLKTNKGDVVFAC